MVVKWYLERWSLFKIESLNHRGEAIDCCLEDWTYKMNVTKRVVEGMLLELIYPNAFCEEKQLTRVNLEQKNQNALRH